MLANRMGTRRVTSHRITSSDCVLWKTNARWIAKVISKAENIITDELAESIKQNHHITGKQCLNAVTGRHGEMHDDAISQFNFLLFPNIISIKSDDETTKEPSTESESGDFIKFVSRPRSILLWNVRWAQAWRFRVSVIFLSNDNANAFFTIAIVFPCSIVNGNGVRETIAIAIVRGNPG